MTQIKRWIAVVLSAVLLLGLVACGEKDVSGTVTGNGKEDISGTVNQEKPTEAETVPSTGAETEPETEPETVPEEEAEFELGVTSGGTYENAFIGIGCSLDESWTFFNEEQIQELNGVMLESTDDEAIREQLEQMGNIYDMYALSADGMATLVVAMENLGVLYGAVMDEEAYIDATMVNLEDGLASYGYTDITLEKVTVDFAGQERLGIQIHSYLSGCEIFQKQVYIKVGNYMANICVTSSIMDITDNLAALFYTVE